MAVYKNISLNVRMGVAQVEKALSVNKIVMATWVVALKEVCWMIGRETRGWPVQGPRNSVNGHLC